MTIQVTYNSTSLSVAMQCHALPITCIKLSVKNISNAQCQYSAKLYSVMQHLRRTYVVVKNGVSYVDYGINQLSFNGI